MSEIAGGTGTGQEQLKAGMDEVSSSLRNAAVDVAAAADAAMRPGMPLDIIARVAREAPLTSLCVAFLIGVAVGRRG